MDLGSGSNTALGGTAPADDEEYDLLNDETFGDIQEDFDWDEATKSAEEISRDDKTEQSGSKLESKVNDLMLDDGPDDPAIITHHAHRIPTRRAESDNLKDLYGPQSPPAYISTIDGLLDPSHDIWGSPVPTGQFLHLGSTTPSTSKPTPDRQDSLRSVYESNGGFPPAPSPPRLREASPDFLDSPAMPANAMTVEELERQMSGGGSSVPVTIPVDVRNTASMTRPGLIPAHPGSPYHQHMMAGTPPQAHMGSPQGHIGSPVGVTMPLHPRPSLSQVMPRMQLAPRPNGTPPGFNHMNMDPRLQQQRNNIRPITILQRNQGPHDSGMYRMSANQPQHHMFNGGGPGMPPHMRMRMPGPAPINRGMGPGMMHHPHMQQRPSLHQYRMNMPGMYNQMPPPPQGPPRDEYAGLLTRHEKDWLIKIQMIQLHTEDPYTDDYYYTIYHIEQNEKLDSDSNSRKSSMNELILPAHAKIETRQYKPMQFEGSLGRLTSSSVHKPRQVVDVKGKEDSIPHTAMETKKYRQTLLITESGYQLILDADEIKKKLPSVPVEQRSEMEEAYKSKLHSLHQLVEENWSALFNVRKGRSLILRTLPLIDKDSSKHLLLRLISAQQLLIKKELADPVDMKAVKRLDSVLCNCNIQTLISYTEKISSSLGAFIKTTLGCYLVLMMIEQAEKIYAAFVEVSHDQTNLWCSFVDSFVSALTTLDSPPQFKCIPMTVYDHLAKRPGAEILLEKVRTWFRKPL